ncbi:uncharacterized protein LOC119062518 isoform X3 [Artibeus jamaicensis]|uniref:uncharacterized protein LOC119062518 isoform X3 n=1 Tax=Artibeus jamaicensis TaxID=9417 RepID=UPI00235AFD60|nr:uncharacterized protein LOC119062518 isoform X3 [Artibeus jamaicensis]
MDRRQEPAWKASLASGQTTPHGLPRSTPPKGPRATHLRRFPSTDPVGHFVRRLVTATGPGVGVRGGGAGVCWSTREGVRARARLTALQVQSLAKRPGAEAPPPPAGWRRRQRPAGSPPPLKQPNRLPPPPEGTEDTRAAARWRPTTGATVSGKSRWGRPPAALPGDGSRPGAARQFRSSRPPRQQTRGSERRLSAFGTRQPGERSNKIVPETILYSDLRWPGEPCWPKFPLSGTGTGTEATSQCHGAHIYLRQDSAPSSHRASPTTSPSATEVLTAQPFTMDWSWRALFLVAMATVFHSSQNKDLEHISENQATGRVQPTGKPVFPSVSGSHFPLSSCSDHWSGKGSDGTPCILNTSLLWP